MTVPNTDPDPDDLDLLAKALLLRHHPDGVVQVARHELVAAADTQCEWTPMTDGSIVFRVRAIIQ